MILDKIVIHLIKAGYLTTDGEMLMLGTEAERVFGRSNWKDLYSVISGGGEYRAMTPDGEVVGSWMHGSLTVRTQMRSRWADAAGLW